MSYKVVYTVHGYRHNHPVRAVVARYLIGAALFLFAYRNITPCTFLRERFACLGKKNVVIFIGEDEALFEDHPLPDFDGGTKRLIFAGEFRTGKNQEFLIKALMRYIERSGDTDVELYLPGKGERLNGCRALVRDLGLGEKVFFPGFLDRNAMIELYLRCQIALIPSNSETFGHCIVEPFALGRVVLTRHVGVADDIVRHGETGFFFEGESDLVELLLAILPNRGLCRQVSAAARSERELFRWDRVCRQHFEFVYEPPEVR
jgi:glycosyltransferase involved in cell wall biosynthesis